ncbi:hypothetical protein TcasGA2_TC013436 [Tribolium castaneum]|uniref:Uncharacterized protein n=1 Tax=Tribolium castaneum TaxID=7070 RepID=D6WLI7_TRICA|nr:hypothetical protein TcasGA2_TC013436 [Tribolium castaneum]
MHKFKAPRHAQSESPFPYGWASADVATRPPGGDLVPPGDDAAVQGRGVGTKRGQNTFYSIQQTQSLICKSDNTPNYQVNMAILYGRWKEVSIWLPASETERSSPLGSKKERRHIDIIKGGQNSSGAERFRGLTTTPKKSLTAAAETSTLTPPIWRRHTGGEHAQGNTLEECIIQHGN